MHTTVIVGSCFVLYMFGVVVVVLATSMVVVCRCGSIYCFTCRALSAWFVHVRF